MHVAYRLNHPYTETDYPLLAKIAQKYTKTHLRTEHTHMWVQDMLANAHRRTSSVVSTKVSYWSLTSDLNHHLHRHDDDLPWWVCACVCVCGIVCLLTPGLCQSSPLLIPPHKLPVSRKADRSREKQGGRERREAFMPLFKLSHSLGCDSGFESGGLN